MYDVVTIGTATRDVFLTSPLFKVLKDPLHLRKIGFTKGEAECFAMGSKIDIGEPLFTTGGGATNAAVTFSRQGFRTASVITLGDDYNAHSVVDDLKKEGITPIVSRSKKPTAYSTLLLSPNGERTILVSRGASDDLSARHVPLKTLATKWVYITPGAIALSAISQLAMYFKRSGAHIALNPSGHYLKMGVRALQPLLGITDVLIVNREEGSLLTHVPYQNERGIFRRLRSYASGLAVMTEADQGALVSDGKEIFRAGIFPEKILIDRTGAGDAFGSGFIAGLMSKGKSPFTQNAIEYAIRLASANATSKVEHIGAKAGILTAKEFKQQARFKKLSIRKTLA